MHSLGGFSYTSYSPVQSVLGPTDSGSSRLHSSNSLTMHGTLMLPQIRFVWPHCTRADRAALRPELGGSCAHPYWILKDSQVGHPPPARGPGGALLEANRPTTFAIQPCWQL